MRHVNRSTGRRSLLRLGGTATAFVLAATGVVVLTGSPAFAAVVPLGCGPWSGQQPPAGYNVVIMDPNIPVYNSLGGPDFVVGTMVADTILLTGTNDIVCSRDGADYVDASGGEDVIYSGHGVDEVYGGLGGDFIHGSQDGDTLVGDSVNGAGAGGAGDVIHGGQGNDDIFGYDGDDLLYGGEDDDDIFGGSGVSDDGDGGNGFDSCDNQVENPISC